MSRYIDADALYMDVIRRYDDCDDFIEMIETAPTADVRENVRGEWVNNIHDLPICNKCGYMTPYDRAIDDYEYGNFCPNCGADMRKGEEE